VDDLWQQIRYIDKLNSKLRGFRLLKSSEVDILADGSLDYPDDLLKELDYTVCSIHSQFGLDQKAQTGRLLRAMDNRYFNILGHATGRLLLKRPGYAIDIERVIDQARQNGCFFEINSSPDRSEVFSAFLEQINSLHEKLGPVLIQLPPSLEFDYARARKFLALIRGSFSGDVVWEPRHGSWFDLQVDALLMEYQIARVAADPACVPAAARPGGLASLAYFRLHGSPRRYFSAYSSDSLNMIVAQAASLGARARVWCIFDNTAFGAAIPNALELAAKLRKL
jgi:hypothetical protein